VLLAGIHAVEGMAWFAALTLGVGFAGRWLRSPAVHAWLDRATGAVLLLVGVRLLVAVRR
jgi:threonine/homoserine/homoserine lactone efflux protein